jgi:hypothetical protein
VAIAVADSARLADPDLWGHVRFGQIVLSGHHLLRHDSFSYSAAGRLFHDHEWLSDIVTASMYNALGVFGLKLMKLAAAAATILLLSFALPETGATASAQFPILLAAAVAVAPFMQFRPQIFTFALLSAVLLILTRDNYRRTGRIWLAIPILIVWANLHGGFIMGIAALGTYAAVTALQDFAAARGPRHAIRLLGATVGAAAASLATPYGLGNWYAIAHALANPYTRVAMADWEPLLRSLGRHLHDGSATAFYDILPLALMAALALAYYAAPDTADLPMVAIAAVVSLAAVLSSRNAPIAAIAIAIPLARHVALAMANRASAADAIRPPPRATLANQAILGTVTLALLFGNNFFSNRLAATAPYPGAAVAFMKRHGLRGNILNNFLWGDYLIWHAMPESKVFIDGRYDTVYPQDVLRQFMLFHFDKAAGATILDAWPHDFVMIAPDSGASRIMRTRSDWKLIYSDSATLLYARAGSPATQIRGVPIAAGVVPASSFP